MSRDTMKYWRSSAPSSPRNVFTQCLRQLRIIFALETRLCEVCCVGLFVLLFFFFFFYFKEPSVLLSQCLMRMYRRLRPKNRSFDIIRSLLNYFSICWIWVQSHPEIFYYYDTNIFHWYIMKCIFSNMCHIF